MILLTEISLLNVLKERTCRAEKCLMGRHDCSRCANYVKSFRTWIKPWLTKVNWRSGSWTGSEADKQGGSTLRSISNVPTAQPDVMSCHVISCPEILRFKQTHSVEFRKQEAFSRIQFESQTKFNSFHSFTVHFNSLYITVQLMHLFVININSNVTH
jgi:hypothetical protein